MDIIQAIIRNIRTKLIIPAYTALPYFERLGYHFDENGILYNEYNHRIDGSTPLCPTGDSSEFSNRVSYYYRWIVKSWTEIDAAVDPELDKLVEASRRGSPSPEKDFCEEALRWPATIAYSEKEAIKTLVYRTTPMPMCISIRVLTDVYEIDEKDKTEILHSLIKLREAWRAQK